MVTPAARRNTVSHRRMVPVYAVPARRANAKPWAAPGHLYNFMRQSQVLIALILVVARAALGQDNAAESIPLNAPLEDKRVFGVVPNNRTTESSLPFAPITAGRKMTIAAKDSFDWPVYLTSGLFAGLYQWEDQNHSFGQGMAGYGKRYAASYGD